MKSKFLKFVLLSTACTFGSFANAGLIVDTADDSFIDATTGLEWMDFGINNHLSYSGVVAQLPTTYSEWRLATESEVVDLWHNAFFEGSSYAQEYATGGVYSSYRALNDAAGMSSFDAAFDAMSTNVNNVAIGWFADTTGGLSYAQYIDRHLVSNQLTNTDDAAYMTGRNTPYSEYQFSTDPQYSTMLVRSSVPESSTLAIFALGMIGLASRRFKKKS